MSAVFAETHIRALQIAKECVALGARIRTVSRITGLEQPLLKSFFYQDNSSTPGRRLESSDWYHRGNLMERAEASTFAVIFDTLLVHHRCNPVDALLGAYRLYLERCTMEPLIPFEHAFNIASELHAMWGSGPPQLMLHSCRRCRSRYLVAIGHKVTDRFGCIFCKLLRRYSSDSHIRVHFAPVLSPT